MKPSRLLCVVLDQMRTGNAERACEPRCFLDQLLVGEAIKRTDFDRIKSRLFHNRAGATGSGSRRWAPLMN